jgi:hypothetical protein
LAICAFRGFEDQIKMVFHQTKGMNLEAGFLAGLAQGFDEIMSPSSRKMGSRRSPRLRT